MVVENLEMDQYFLSDFFIPGEEENFDTLNF
jgi:hypothetical protein